MARRPRLDMAGFHPIVNRGVAKDNVYRCDEKHKKHRGQVNVIVLTASFYNPINR